MAKKGMARPDWTPRPHNDVPSVPELQGRAKHTKQPARPIIAGTQAPALKVYHARPHAAADGPQSWNGLDNDLARDNLENDLPAADRDNG